MAEIKFEEALKKLEKIVSELEKGDLALDESLARYEEGVKLAKACTRQLEAAKSKVELLMKSGSRFEVKPFDVPEAGPSGEDGGAPPSKAKIRRKRADRSGDSDTLV